MAATHKITIQLHLVAESCNIYSSRSRRPVQKLLDTPSYGRVDLCSWILVFFASEIDGWECQLHTPLQAKEPPVPIRQKFLVEVTKSTFLPHRLPVPQNLSYVIFT